jgi:DNA-directed RNA polymerase subunit RPC12/RpoP
VYDADEQGDTTAIFRVRRVEYKCFKCDTTNVVLRHKLQDGIVLVCAKCRSKSRVETYFHLAALDENAS